MAYEPLPDWAEAGFESPADHALSGAAAAMAFHASRIAQARQAIRGWTAHGGALGQRMAESNRRGLRHHRRRWTAARARWRRLAALLQPTTPALRITPAGTGPLIPAPPRP